MLNNFFQRTVLMVLLCTNSIALWHIMRGNTINSKDNWSIANGLEVSDDSNDSLIIVITATHYRLEQLADLTRLSQTLRLVPNLHWIVVEDSVNISATIERLLNRSTLNYTHLAFHRPSSNSTKKMGKGWAPRNHALSYLRSLYSKDSNQSAVVYIADDDNTYDIRLFNNHIRYVKTVGVWAVGLVGSALVEAPRVKNGTVVGFDVQFAKGRKFAIDMAGFAVSLRLILSTNATFGERCIGRVPESCFLEQLGIAREQLQPFGCEGDEKEVLVWHTKTSSSGKNGPSLGYVI